MTKVWIETLLSEIEAKKNEAAKITGVKLTTMHPTELPVEAYLGSLKAVSPAGSIINFYSYYDPMFKTKECIQHTNAYWTQHITQVTFVDLKRVDKIFFMHKWTDHKIYNMETYHKLLRYLINSDFTFYVGDFSSE